MPLILTNTNDSGGFNLINNGAAGSFTTSLTAAPPSGSLITSVYLAGSAIVSSSFTPFSGGGNSYYLNGTTSYMTASAGVNWAMGTGDYTIEWFQYQTSQPANPRVFSVGNYSTATWAVSIEGGTFYLWEVNSYRFSSALTSYLNSWQHFAISRISNTTSVYRNGTKIGSSFTDNNNINNTTTAFTIGQETTPTANSYFPGYITNMRVVKQLGVYTGNFTTPTSALTAVASANPYGGSNTQAIPSGFTQLLLVP